MLRRMEEEGIVVSHVEKIPGERNRPRRHYALTEIGLELMNAIMPPAPEQTREDRIYELVLLRGLTAAINPDLTVLPVSTANEIAHLLGDGPEPSTVLHECIEASPEVTATLRLAKYLARLYSQDRVTHELFLLALLDNPHALELLEITRVSPRAISQALHEYLLTLPPSKDLDYHQEVPLDDDLRLFLDVVADTSVRDISPNIPFNGEGLLFYMLVTKFDPKKAQSILLAAGANQDTFRRAVYRQPFQLTPTTSPSDDPTVGPAEQPIEEPLFDVPVEQKRRRPSR